MKDSRKEMETDPLKPEFIIDIDKNITKIRDWELQILSFNFWMASHSLYEYRIIFDLFCFVLFFFCSSVSMYIKQVL